MSFAQMYRGVELPERIKALIVDSRLFAISGKVIAKSTVNNKIDSLLTRPLLSADDARKLAPESESIGSENLQSANGLLNRIFFIDNKLVRAFACTSGKLIIIDIVDGKVAWTVSQRSFCKAESDPANKHPFDIGQSKLPIQSSLTSPLPETPISGSFEANTSPTKILRLKRNGYPFWFTLPTTDPLLGWIPLAIKGYKGNKLGQKQQAYRSSQT